MNDDRVGDIFLIVKGGEKGKTFKSTDIQPDYFCGGKTIYEKINTTWSLGDFVINLSARGRKAHQTFLRRGGTHGKNGRFECKQKRDISLHSKKDVNILVPLKELEKIIKKHNAVGYMYFLVVGEEMVELYKKYGGKV